MMMGNLSTFMQATHKDKTEKRKRQRRKGKAGTKKGRKR